jgi:AI-2 transport protein TqsA
LKTVFSGRDDFNTVNVVLSKIEKSITSYIGLKTLISFITGLASYVALLFIGIDAPLFWTFLIFLLNYIPTIGSLIGTLFPAMFCILQFGGFTECFLVLGFVGVVQVIVGNLLEPKLMGNSLNISPLIAILALSFWGAIWGITGMLLSVPITVIMVIIFANFKSTKPVAIMLSENGRV